MCSGLNTTIVGLFFLCVITSVGAENSNLPDPLKAGWKGKTVCELLFEDKNKRILRCSFPPGIGHEKHFHSANFGYAISGGTVRITDQSGIREVKLPTGSSFSSDGIAWHEIFNIGETTIVYLIVEDKAQPN